MLFCQSVEKPRSIDLSLIHVLLVVTSLVACYCWVSGHLYERKQANHEAHKQTNKTGGDLLRPPPNECILLYPSLDAACTS